ncbi:hypothetical protein [Intrasporangium sp. YIM S08009]|uniref:hypothetical protein n=1 Tax=Intrasporangium zincisolvens TaxID=3080018 RepID=UPI002B05883E|nr:hypothetical protein [Intrasporangium sp. YIM S08009]
MPRAPSASGGRPDRADTAAWALRRVAEGLHVPERDVERIEERFEGARAGRGRRPRRPGHLLLVLAVVLSLGLSAVALVAAQEGGGRRAGLAATRATGWAGTDAEALDAIAGLWRVEEDSAWPPLWVIRADGTFEVLRARDLLADRPGEGSVAVMLPDGLRLADASGCSATFRAERPAADRLRLHWLTADGGCHGDFGPEPAWFDSDLTRVVPTSTPVVSRYVGGRPQQLRWESGLDGVWLLQGSGRLLVVDGRTYAVVDDVTRRSASGERRFVEQGSVSTGTRGLVELRPTGLSCPRAYRVWTDYATLDSRLQESSCGRLGGAADTWVRLM